MNLDHNREKTLFNEALELPKAERAGYLKGACRGDEGLLARLDRLLAAHEGAGEFPVGEPREEPVQTVVGASQPQEEAGLLVGRYKLLERLGEGGFGAVWLAEQREPVRRKVALKIIKLGMDTRQVVARFEAERQALALMDHPNIAKVLDAGTTDSGRPYFVMELVRGIPVTRFCDENRLMTRERLGLFIKVCQAIQHAHQKGIIHRDIKPSNILVTLHDGVAVPKVIDFGIAKATQGELTDKTIHTQFQQFIGTPAYMSPEQAEMSGLDMDTRSDIYSLGVLLYELLTGRTPFDGKELLVSGLDAMRRTIREQEPLRPSTRLDRLEAAERTETARRQGSEPAKLARSLRGDLDWVVMKCLEKDRTRRYETANGLAADLNRHLNNEPVVARPPSARDWLQKAFRRHKVAFAAGAAIAAALVIGLALSTILFLRARAASRQAQVAEVVARTATEAEKKQRLVAEKTASDLVKTAAELRESLYAFQMNATFQTWKEGRVANTRELLDRQRPDLNSKQPDLRGFDWRFLWQNSRRQELFTLTNAARWGFALSPDGQTVAAWHGTEAGDLALWNISTRQPIAILATNTGWSFSMAFSPDGQTLVSTHSTEPAKVWDVANRRLAGEIQSDLPILGVSFSPDGATLATAEGSMYYREKPGRVQLWSVARREVIRTLPGSTTWVYQTSFSPDGEIVAGSSGDGVVTLWNVGTGSVIRQLSGHNGFVEPVCFSHDGKTLAVGDQLGYVWLWDWEARRPRAVFQAHAAPIYSLAFSPDDRHLFTGSRDHTARMWDCQSRRELVRFAGHTGGVTCLQLFSDGRTMVTAGQDGALRFWDARAEMNIDGLAAQASGAGRIVLTTGGRFLAQESGEEVAFFDTGTGAKLKVIPGKHVGASPNGKRIALVRGSKLVFLHPVTLVESGTIECGTGVRGAPAFSADGKWLAVTRTSSGHDEILVVDVEQSRIVKVLNSDGDAQVPLLFARAGAVLLSGGPGDGEIYIWETAGWNRTILRGPPWAGLRALSVSPDGKTLASGGKEGVVSLWNLEHPSERTVLRSSGGEIHSLAYAPDGKILALGALDGSVRFWNVAARQEVAWLSGHSSYVVDLAFSQDGKLLASTGFDRTLRIWRAPSWAEIDEAEAGSTRTP